MPRSQATSPSACTNNATFARLSPGALEQQELPDAERPERAPFDPVERRAARLLGLFPVHEPRPDRPVVDAVQPHDDGARPAPGVTDPGGGICPGPVFSQASWAGPASGWASVGGSANACRLRSRKSDRSAAAASRCVSAGRFHLRSAMARIEVWSCTMLVT